MTYIADLHIHSRYSRATSRECTPENLDLWARRKGIHLIGTGDLTHRAWREELLEKLEPDKNGLYVLKEEYRIKDASASDAFIPHFVVTGEISSIYKKYEKTRKVHSLFIMPSLEEAKKFSAKLETIGNIDSDGRPILGLDCRNLLEIMLELVPEGIYVPAHVWTPHFSIFGTFSSFDSVEECFEDLAPYVRTLETGLSADPAMMGRISSLDSFHLISSSDAHSPSKLGREATLLDGKELSYETLRKALLEGKGLEGTLEFFPEEGKYYLDGHRKCGVCLTPEETKKLGGRCPVCGRKLTKGVCGRIDEMADRPESYVRADAKKYESLVPLPELIGASEGKSAAGVRVQRKYLDILQKIGSELEILRTVPLEDIAAAGGQKIAEGVQRLREGKVERIPGFDGQYGTIRLYF